MRSLQKLKRCGSTLQSGCHSVAISRRNATPQHSTLKAPPPSIHQSTHWQHLPVGAPLCCLVWVLNTSRFYRLNCGQFSIYFFSVLVIVVPCTILKLMCSRNKHIINSEFVPKLVCYNYGWVLCQCYLILYFCIIYTLRNIIICCDLTNVVVYQPVSHTGKLRLAIRNMRHTIEWELLGCPVGLFWLWLDFKHLY